MKRKTIIISFCIALCVLVCIGAYLHYNATSKEVIENAQLGKSYAQKYNGKNVVFAMAVSIAIVMDVLPATAIPQNVAVADTDVTNIQGKLNITESSLISNRNNK